MENFFVIFIYKNIIRKNWDTYEKSDKLKRSLEMYQNLSDFAI